MRVELDNLITINDICDMFGVTHQTIYNWRTRHDLPFIQLPDHRIQIIRFEYPKIVKWAKKHNKKVLCDPRETRRPTLVA